MSAPRRGRDVLAAIFEPCDRSHFIDVRFLGPRPSQFFVPVDDLAAVGGLCTAHPDLNAYFGVALRDGLGGDLPHCRQLAVLHVDADRLDRGQLEQRLASCGLKPSIIVASGGGFHIYFLLKEPLELPADAERAKNLERRLALRLGGDLVSAEPARILRIPGTKNLKYDPPRPVTVVTFDDHIRYNVSDLDDWLPADTIQTTAPAPWSMGEKLRPGDRNNVLYRLTRSLLLKELPASVIATTVRTVNVAHGDPPLGEAELSDLLAHALRQPNRPLTTSSRIRVEVASDAH